MKQYTACVMLSLCSGTILHGAEFTTFPDITTTDSDQKIRGQSTMLSPSAEDKRAAEVLWDQAYLYKRCRGDQGDKTKVLKTWQWILEQNPQVLRMKKDKITVFIEGRSGNDCCYELTNASPLGFIICSALNQLPSSSEWQVFTKIVRLADNDDRIRSIGLGIQHNSVAIVQEMLAAKTDLTSAPQIMPLLVERCVSLHAAYSHEQDYEYLPYRLPLLKIISLLLRDRADLTKVLQSDDVLHHCNNEICIGCQLIVHNINQRKLQQSCGTKTDVMITQSGDGEKERDKKIIHQSEQDGRDPKLFWEHVNKYHEYRGNKSFLELVGIRYDRTKKKSDIETTLDTLYSLLEKNPRIFSSRSSNDELHKHYNVKSCSPLMMAALMTLGRSAHSPERTFLTNITPLAPHDQRIEVINLGIKRLSFPLVKTMVCSNMDVKHTPEMMSAIMDRCEGLSKSYNHQHDLLRAEYCLFGITSLLLEAGANLTGITQRLKRPHLKDDACFNCQFIVDSMNSQPCATIPPLPSAPPSSLYPHLNPASSSSFSQLSSLSSSSSTSVSSSSLSSCITPGSEHDSA